MYVDIISSIGEDIFSATIQSVPNPFNKHTRIQFGLKEKEMISILIYDFKGQCVKTMVQDQEFDSGNHSISWDATNDFGAQVENGIYFYHLTTGSEIHTGKMIYLR